MEKVKIFSSISYCNINDFEELINKWLLDANVKICRVLQSPCSTNSNIIITIFYEEKLPRKLKRNR